MIGGERAASAHAVDRLTHDFVWRLHAYAPLNPAFLRCPDGGGCPRRHAGHPAFADPRDFDVVNNTSIVLSHVYVSPSDTLAWGDDILGRDVLYSGETVSVSFREFDGNSCLYDVKVVGLAGQEGNLFKVDLCTVYTVTFND